MRTVRPKVLVTRTIPEAGIRLLDAACDVVQWRSDEVIPRDTLKAMLADKDACLTLVTERFDADLFDAAPRLKVVANFAVGYDNLDVPEATRRGIMLTNTPDVLTDTTADYAWMLLMAAARNVLPGTQYIAAGNWTSWKPNIGVGPDIHGATLGIIGMGSIGRAVARRASGFGMRILYHGPHRYPDAEASLGAEYRERKEDLLCEADFVSIHAPLTPDTYHLIDADALALMKPTAVLVNTARGAVVDTDALVSALSAHRLFAAGLDVTDPEPLPANHPLMLLPNCIVTPHIASASFATRDATSILAARNILAALRGERPPSLINPEVFHENRVQ